MYFQFFTTTPHNIHPFKCITHVLVVILNQKIPCHNLSRKSCKVMWSQRKPRNETLKRKKRNRGLLVDVLYFSTQRIKVWMQSTQLRPELQTLTVEFVYFGSHVHWKVKSDYFRFGIFWYTDSIMFGTYSKC